MSEDKLRLCPAYKGYGFKNGVGIESSYPCPYCATKGRVSEHDYYKIVTAMQREYRLRHRR